MWREWRLKVWWKARNCPLMIRCWTPGWLLWAVCRSLSSLIMFFYRIKVPYNIRTHTFIYHVYILHDVLVQMQMYRYLQEGVMKDAAFGIPLLHGVAHCHPRNTSWIQQRKRRVSMNCWSSLRTNVTAFTLSNGKQNLVVWIVKISHTTLLGRDDYSLLPPLLTHQYDRMGCDGT